ncbi:MAG TPA: cobalt ECF transporter T component CbiQ [Thermomicrobiaceae bacterium]|nr:cobalt ECF transporter T component CbiQ [Thermomicrobiaceae bacterium]
MTAEAPRIHPHPHPRRRGRRDFIAKTIGGVTEVVERAVYTEEHARRAGLLQRVDARAKLGVFLAAVLVVGLAHTLWIILALYALTLALGLTSRIPADLLLKRVLLGIPLFAGIVALPALLLGHGEALVEIGRLGPLHLVITRASLLGFVIFVSRVAASVTLAALLVVTTRWADLLKALRAMRVPEAFVVVLGMTYRYIFLFLRALENLLLARASRTVGVARDQEARRWVGATIGTLLGKSLRTSNEVYQAMVARGYSGDIRTLSSFQMRDEDWLFTLSSLVLLAVALLIDLSLRWR